MASYNLGAEYLILKEGNIKSMLEIMFGEVTQDKPPNI